MGLVFRGPIYCTSIKYESRLHTKNLIDPHSGQTTPKGLPEGFAHASLDDTPTNSLRVPSLTCFPGLFFIGPKKCCRSVRHIHAANALTAHVSNAQLKLRVTTLLGAPLRFWVPCKSELYAPHPKVLSGVEIGHHLPRESLIIRHSEPKRETRSDLPAVLCQVAFLLSTCSG